MKQKRSIMRDPTSWLICGTTGRWAASLRLALVRKLALDAHTQLPRHIREVYSVCACDSALQEHCDAIVLVEIRSENLAEALHLIATCLDRKTPAFALLGESLHQQNLTRHVSRNDREAIIAAIGEAGALDVLDTPRQIARVLEVVARGIAARPAIAAAADLATLAEFAQAALPWQDA